MKIYHKAILSLFTAIITQFAYGQAYVYFAKDNTEMYHDKKSGARVYRKIKKGDMLLMDSLITHKNMYKVKLMHSRTRGWVEKSNLELFETITIQKLDSLKKAQGEHITYAPVIMVVNESKINKLLFSIDGKQYRIDPLKNQSFTVTPKKHHFSVKSPAMVPYYSSDVFLNDRVYKMSFYF